MKNIRKNKTKQVVKWSYATLFTISDLLKLNPSMKEITLRVRLNNAIQDGKISEIGAIPGGKGRPPKIYSNTPVTKETLDKARVKGINLVDNAEKIFNVVSITTPTPVPIMVPVTT